VLLFYYKGKIYENLEIMHLAKHLLIKQLYNLRQGFLGSETVFKVFDN
jgi:hypothetical protein